MHLLIKKCIIAGLRFLPKARMIASIPGVSAMLRGFEVKTLGRQWYMFSITPNVPVLGKEVFGE
jgi:hypothetical protein